MNAAIFLAVCVVVLSVGPLLTFLGSTGPTVHALAIAEPRPNVIAAEAVAMHENDRAWRLDEWNRGIAHPSTARQRHTDAEPEFIERSFELARWNFPNAPRHRIIGIVGWLPTALGRHASREAPGGWWS
jgi:hypothetical protein